MTERARTFDTATKHRGHVAPEAAPVPRESTQFVVDWALGEPCTPQQPAPGVAQDVRNP